MQAYSFDIEVKTTRRALIVAADLPSAERGIRETLAPNERLLSGAMVALERSESEARAAVRHLLRRAFLPIAGMDARLSDWLAEAVAGNPVAQERLAIAGMRLRDDNSLAIGSAKIPQLRDWLRQTRWAGPAFHPTLLALPGACRVQSPLRLAGVQSRCVALPLDLVMTEVTG